MRPVTALDGVQAPPGAAGRVREGDTSEGAKPAPESGVCRVCGCTEAAACVIDVETVTRIDPRAVTDDLETVVCAWVEDVDPPKSLCDAPECLIGLQVWEDAEGINHLYIVAEDDPSVDGTPAPAPFVTDYDAKGEAVDRPIQARVNPPATPTGEGQSGMFSGSDLAAMRVGVWAPIDGYNPTSVELGFGGRVELSLNAHDRALAEQLRLNKRVIIRAFARVDGRNAKVLRKKGAFDGVTVKVAMFVYGLGLVGPADDPDAEGEETDELLMLNQIDTLQGKLSGIGEAARDLLIGKATLNRLKAFVEKLAELADTPATSEPEADDDIPDNERPDDTDLKAPADATPLEQAMAEASEALGEAPA